MPNTKFQNRARSRARRLGLEPKYRYTRDQARSLKTRLAKKRSGSPDTGGTSFGGADAGSPGSPDTRSTTGGSGASSTSASSKGSNLVFKGRSGINRVKSGAGSKRSGKQFQVAYNPETKKFTHVYGRGKKARKVQLNNDVAASYGYKRK